MTDVQQQTLQRLSTTSQKVADQVAISHKRLELVNKDCEARRAQLLLLQQDLLYITQALRRMQRLCDQQAGNA